MAGSITLLHFFGIRGGSGQPGLLQRRHNLGLAEQPEEVNHMYGSLIATVFPDVRDRRLDLLLDTTLDAKLTVIQTDHHATGRFLLRWGIVRTFSGDLTSADSGTIST